MSAASDPGARKRGVDAVNLGDGGVKTGAETGLRRLQLGDAGLGVFERFLSGQQFVVRPAFQLVTFLVEQPLVGLKYLRDGGGNRTLTLAALADTEGRPVEVAPGNGHRVLADLGAGVDGALISRLF